MKTLILSTLTLFLMHCGMAQSSTNIVLSHRFQWSTNNGISWLDDIPSGDFDDTIVVPVGDIAAPSFFRLLILDDGEFGIWHRFTGITYQGYSVLGMTNAIATNDFFVYPNTQDGYGTNIMYRGLLTLTNQYRAVYETCTNCAANTNSPSPP